MGTTILLLGKQGQVGWELQRSLAPLGMLWALGRDSTVNLQQGRQGRRAHVARRG